MQNKLIIALLINFLLLLPLSAAPLTIDYEKSAIRFAGKYAGKTFTGVFSRWQGLIDLGAGKIEATFDLSAAKTGDRTYDRNLPKKDWFWVDRYPQAKFVSTAVTKLENGRYQVKGLLTIRDITLPIEFKMLMVDQTLSATFMIDRLAYAIGKRSDPEAEWVEQMITTTLDIAVSN